MVLHFWGHVYKCRTKLALKCLEEGMLFISTYVHISFATSGELLADALSIKPSVHEHVYVHVCMYVCMYVLHMSQCTTTCQ